MLNRMICTLALIAAICLGLSSNSATGQTKASWDAARKKMVDEYIITCGIKNQRVIQAMIDTLRHEFVPSQYRKQAYYDSAIAIGEAQTISSPFIVAYMTECLDPQPTDRVLEVGTGSGYQAAVLGEIVDQVYTIEIGEDLGRNAAKTLKRLDYDNVHVRVGDGFQGWPKYAPFNKIIATCSPERVPQPLIDQLAEGGLMIIAVGERYQQSLYLFRKRDGKLESEVLRPTLFVPMTGRAESLRQVQPDPANPSILNGNFELPIGDDGFVQGWYYERQAKLVDDAKAPQGERYVEFKNDDVGRAAHMLQGFPVDGSKVASLKVTAQVKSELTFPGPSKGDVPLLAISFYVEERRDLGVGFLGPFVGTQDWHEEAKLIAVPRQAKEGIIRIGLFGATGTITFDAITLEKGSVRPGEK